MMAGGFGEFRGDFSRSGLRFDEEFLRQAFFGGGRGPSTKLRTGFVFVGSMGPGGFSAGRGTPAQAATGATLLGRASAWILTQIGRGVLALFTYWVQRLLRKSQQALDLTYAVQVKPSEARAGTTVEIAYPRGGRTQRLNVKVPPSTRPGTRLKLSGMGATDGFRTGDLFLIVNVG
jgi:hypothetical protein